jgi:hypothetical protein
MPRLKSVATQKLVCDEVNKESDLGLLQKPAQKNTIPAQKTIVEYTQKSYSRNSKIQWNRMQIGIVLVREKW